jgi:5-formyltetrahydrofolate cyclo-ligase
MCFLPITEQNEVDTELILHLLSGKTKRFSFQNQILKLGNDSFLLTDNTRIAKTSIISRTC